MKSTAQVVVIGGGVVGASVLYHLTKAGWTDVVLLERKQLTAGSTWHAAGGMHTLNGDPNVARLQQYTVNLYQRDRGRVRPELQHPPPGRADAGRHPRTARLAAHGARPRPLPRDAHGPDLDRARPSSSTRCSRSTSSSARSTTPTRGRSTRTASPTPTRSAPATAAPRSTPTRGSPGSPSAPTARGTSSPTRDHTIHAEHVVNCGGLWAREVGRMVGLELPVLAMEHHYLVTEPMQEVIDYNARAGRELPHMIDFAGEIYARQEGQCDPARHVRAGQQAVVAARDAVGLRVPVARPRPRPHRPRARARLRPLPRRRPGRHPALRQRPVHVQPRRQPAGRPDPRHARHVGRLRGDGRAVAGRRCRPVARQLDGRRRPGRRHLGHGRRPLRRLGDARLHQRQGPRELLAAVPDHVPQRGAAGGAPVAHDADLRPPHRAQRGVGRRVRARAPAVVPAPRSRADRGRHVPPLERVRAASARSRAPCASGSGSSECSNFAKYRVSRRGRRRLAAGPVHQPAARRSAART